MTALPGRRRRSTLIASLAAGVAVVTAAGLAILGGVTLYHSTEGADAASGVPELVFPSTPTGALAAVDESGALASVAVLVVQPSGAGGSIVTVPVSADSTNGKGDERLPIAETVALSGPDALEPELESMLGLGIDAFEVVDADRLAALLEGIGPVEVELPADVTGAEGDVVAEEGTATLGCGRGGGDPDRPRSVRAGHRAVSRCDGGVVRDRRRDGRRWHRLGRRRQCRLVSRSMPCWRRSPGGPVGARGLRAEPLDAELNPRGVDVEPARPGRDHPRLRPDRARQGRRAEPRPHPADRSALLGRAARGHRLRPTTTRSPTRRSRRCCSSAPTCCRWTRSRVRQVRRRWSNWPTRRWLPRLPASTCCSAASTCRSAETRIVGVDAVVRLGTDYLEFIAEASGDEGAADG